MSAHRAAVAYCVRADSRRSWRSWLALGLLFGVAAGSVLAAAAGARRTSTAYQDLITETAAFDAAVVPPCEPDEPGCPSATEFVDEVRTWDGVAAAGVLGSVQTPVVDAHGVWETNGDACNTGSGEISAMIPLDDHVGHDLLRIRILEGRDVDPTRTDEAVLAPEAAALHGVRVGDTLTLHLGADVTCDDQSTWGSPTELTVVGIGLTGAEVPPKSGFYIQGIHLSPALSTLESAQANAFVLIRFEPGATLDDLPESAGRPGFRPAFNRATDLRGDDIEAGLRSDANAFWLVAALGAVAACFVLGPTLARYRWTAAAVDTTLGAVGWARRDRILRSTAHALAISAVAGTVAAAVMLAASTRTPIGDAQSIEPDPGVELDVVVLLVGWAGLTVLVTLGLAVLAWPSRARATAPRRAPLSTAAARLGVPARAVLGIRIGLEPGPRQAPVRSSVFALTLGVAGVIGVLVYTGSAHHLAATPGWRGVPWDDIVPVDEVADGLALTQRVADWPEVQAAGNALFYVPPLILGEDHLEGRAMAFSTGADDVTPTVIDGRAPIAADETLLNPGLAADLGVGIGDEIEAAFDLTDFAGPEAGITEPFMLEVVGTGVVPIGDGRFERAMAITREGLLAQAATFPGAEDDEEPTGERRIDLLFINRADGVSDAAIVRRLAAEDIPYSVDPAAKAAFLDNLVSTDPTSTEAAPNLLAALMAIMGAGVLAYGLSVSVLRNSRDLAVVRTLGLTPRLVRSTARWAGVSFVTPALVVAVPLGVVVGRMAWRRYAEGLGVVTDPSLPVGPILACILATVLLGAVVGDLSARWESRTRPGAALRSE